MHSKYFTELENESYKLKEGSVLVEYMDFLKSLDERNEPAILYCYNLLNSKLNKLSRQWKKTKYKITDNINPRGEEFHITEDFIYLMDAEEISGSTKLYAQQMLVSLNEYYGYLNKYSIEINKYPKHRRDIHDLNPDIELPQTQKEILTTFEDQTKDSDPVGYKYFLNAVGVSRSPKRSDYDKLIKDLSSVKHIKEGTK